MGAGEAVPDLCKAFLHAVAWGRPRQGRLSLVALMENKPETTAFYRHRLPHWEVFEGRYFITICQHGAIPIEAASKIRKLRRELAVLKGGALLDQKRRIFAKMEEWLDQPRHPGMFDQPVIAGLLTEAIQHRHLSGEWRMIEYVIMPSHIHLFIKLLNRNLSWSINDFKRWTGHQALKILGNGTEDFWHREWFDHWSRSPEEDEKIVRYIRNNPVKAGLVDDYTHWLYGSWTKSAAPAGGGQAPKATQFVMDWE